MTALPTARATAKKNRRRVSIPSQGAPLSEALQVKMEKSCFLSKVAYNAPSVQVAQTAQWEGHFNDIRDFRQPATWPDRITATA